MGSFEFRVRAVGGHGCQRDAREGEEFTGCGRMGCPDCEARMFVSRVGEAMSVERATLTHWPDDPTVVVDNLAPPARGDYDRVGRGMRCIRERGDFKGTAAKPAGQIAFEAYNDSVGGVTWDGKPIPAWGEVTDKVRAGWTAAAKAAKFAAG